MTYFVDFVSYRLNSEIINVTRSSNRVPGIKNRFQSSKTLVREPNIVTQGAHRTFKVALQDKERTLTGSSFLRVYVSKTDYYQLNFHAFKRFIIKTNRSLDITR